VPKFKLAGESETDPRPAPERDKICGVFMALSVIVRAPGMDPVTEGVNATEILQVAFGCKVCPAQVSVSEKSPLATRLLMVRATLPELVKVTLFEALV
jgi:hypothetical protein